MKLEVGMYVRTNKGYIGKLKNHYLDSITESNEYVFENGYGFSEADYEYITKHSNNLIDLIEVGDYVNGYKVISKPFYDSGYITFGLSNNTNFDSLCEIKEIITHYQQEEYVIGDDKK